MFKENRIPLTVVLEELEKSPDFEPAELEKLKRKYSRKLGLTHLISNAQLIEQIRGKESQGVELEGDKRMVQRLRKSAGRSMSGVAVVAIMLPPVSCPYHCAYCPTSKIAAKSYTGHEPAALRARQNGFDSAKQVTARLRQFEKNGHDTEKCELIVMGGTFNSLVRNFQKEFVKGAFDAFNECKSKTLEQAQEINETAKHRVVSLTFETRPDWASNAQVDELLSFGATRVEFGVQSLDDAILAKVKRGHGVKETVQATQNCKDAFLKVGYHMMPGLYSTPEKDEKTIAELFEDERFKPDMLKIYPTLVIPGTELFELWQKGEFTPYDEQTAAEAIARMKRHVPEYCRIMRVDRDIPTHQIAAGVKKTNLRELVEQKCKQMGVACRCIRCREAGLKQHKKGAKIDFENAELKIGEYNASGGKEYFLHYEDSSNDAILAFLRLRKPSDFGLQKENESSKRLQMGVRELRVYGEQVKIGDHSNALSSQHKSFGKKLLENAEEIAKAQGAKQLLVTSGVGVREYYAKLGYLRESHYMAKAL